MYWLPGLFVVFELFLLAGYSSLWRFAYATKVLKKFKDTELENHIKYHYKEGKGWAIFYAFYYLFLLVYFIIGLFHSIWIYSCVFIGWLIFSHILDQIFPDSIEKCIKRAKFENLDNSSSKLSRYLKLEELKEVSKNNGKSYWEPLTYILPVIRIFTLLSIIILHYHFLILK